MSWDVDDRIVLTLDAGGTNFAFSAVQRGRQIGDSVVLPAAAHDLETSLSNLIRGFEQLIRNAPARPVAISFAFPGPADYPRGIIDNVGNLPAYAGGVALGPMLADHFDVPVFVNNDGDLFAYGEAIAGLLPTINQLLTEARSPKRYQNLFAITLGTGFGGGIVQQGQLFLGDNSAAGEVWLLRNKVRSDAFAEEGASIRAVRSVYAASAGFDVAAAPTPQEIFEIGMERVQGDTKAAQLAFAALGEVVGDALANAITLIDGLVVIGGGLAGAAPLFMPRLLDELNGSIAKYDGQRISRLVQRSYNLDDQLELKQFLRGDSRMIAVPRSNRSIAYDPVKRIGVGISKLGTSQAVGIGAYAYALHELDRYSAAASGYTPQ